MTSNVSIVDPPAPATGTLLILDTDSLSSSTLYPPGGSADAPAFAFTSADDAKRISLHRGGKDGAVEGVIALHGLFKKGLGTVALGARELKLEEWGRATKDGVAVGIHGKDYLWVKRHETDPQSPNMPKASFQALLEGEAVVIYTHSSMSAHDGPFSVSSAPKVITRGHVHFAPDVDEKAVPELLLSLALFKQLDIKYGPNPGSSNPIAWSMMSLSCPVQ